MRRNEIVLPRRVKLQPVPPINPPGDCGPCVLGALLEMEPQEVYAYAGILPQSLGYFHVKACLELALEDGRIDRVVDDGPIWPCHHATGYYGTTMNAGSWFRYIRMGMEAGYYAISFVSFKERGPFELPDHLVLLCGARETSEEVGAPSRYEVLVSCSAHCSWKEEWVEARAFLQRRGGFNSILVRPARSFVVSKLKNESSDEGRLPEDVSQGVGYARAFLDGFSSNLCKFLL